MLFQLAYSFDSKAFSALLVLSETVGDFKPDDETTDSKTLTAVIDNLWRD